MIWVINGRKFNVAVKKTKDDLDYSYCWRIDEYKDLKREKKLIGLGFNNTDATYDDAVMSAFRCIWEFEFSNEHEHTLEETPV